MAAASLVPVICLLVIFLLLGMESAAWTLATSSFKLEKVLSEIARVFKITQIKILAYDTVSDVRVGTFQLEEGAGIVIITFCFLNSQ